MRRLQVAFTVVAMLGALLLASRSASHLAPCESRSDVESRVASLSDHMQALANAQVITMEQLASAVQSVNAADVQYTPSSSFQQHCAALDAVAATLPANQP